MKTQTDETRTEKLIRKWTSTGLLAGLPETRQGYTANLLEDAASILLAEYGPLKFSDPEEKKSTTETVLPNILFPIVRRLADSAVEVKAAWLVKDLETWLGKNLSKYFPSDLTYFHMIDAEVDMVKDYVASVISRKTK